ncbi:hypothetical protein [Methylobacterium sp. CM6244]
MSDDNEPRDGAIASHPQAPDTGLFQVQYGPDGACRIVLIDQRSPAGEPRVIGTLTLPAKDADELAHMMEPARRRQMWKDMADQAAKGAQH